MTTRHRALIAALPKVELHLHIEGSLEPEMMFDLARRNGVTLPYASVDDIRAAYRFDNLQSFLDLYYAGAGVLIEERDFYDLTWAYLQRARADNIVHCELFFDPQTHTARGVPFATVLNGIRRALDQARRELGITSKLILSFLRHLSEEDGFATLDQARPYLDVIDGVGLDSSEQGNPPAKFARLFAACKALGLPRVAHAGEEGPADYIRDAIDLLDVCRIDHGVRILDDGDLVARLALARTPLTVCPYSNVRLKVCATLEQHPLRTMLNAGLCVTLNSDDPAYFGGYLQENWLGCAHALNLERDELLELAINGFEASWLDAADKAMHIAACRRIAATFPD